MDSSSQNWLGFSLCNPSHFSLFHGFDSTSPPQGGFGVEKGEKQEAQSAGTDLSIFTGRPKLENFLGVSTVTGSPAPTPAHFSAEHEIYESELKTIAASFLRGYASEQVDVRNQSPVPESAPVIQSEQTVKKALDTFGQRTSIYRGVTRHRWTGRYEAHLWDNSCRREGQSRKGRQVYLGGYDKEDKAARAYDLAALKYWGPTTTTNFSVCNYERELEEMKNMTRQEFVASLRRKSSGFSRGASIYRGVTRHHQHGRWQARIGRVAGNKDLYLGTFGTQEEAAEAYDIAAIKFRGLNAVTNFDMSRYDIKSIASTNLPIGGVAGKSKTSSDSISDGKSSKSLDGNRLDDRDHSASSSSTFPAQRNTSALAFSMPIKQDPSDNNYWPMLSYQNSSFLNSRNPNAPFSMEFSSGSSVDEGYNIHLQNGGHSDQISSQFSAPICLNAEMNAYEGSNHSGYGNLVGQTMYSKPNFFQTAIFGVE